MTDSTQQAPDLQEVGRKALELFRESKSKVFALNVAAMEFDVYVSVDNAREAIAWLHTSGYIAHNDNLAGWDTNSVTDAGHHYYEACQQAANDAA